MINTENNRSFLPVSPQELAERQTDRPDFVYVIGDAYVDHPSFGPAIIGRVLESRGYSVCIIAQPDWKDPASIAIFGEPRLGFLVSAGNMDSMVNHYTAAKKRRSSDSYSPGGKAGCRPDRAVIVYANLIRQMYKKTPIIVGGIEASLRRMAHYDYWSDSLRRSVLMDCGADLVSYGMGERSIVEIADALSSGISAADITFVAGTCFRTKNTNILSNCLHLPSYEEMRTDPKLYAQSFRIQYENTDSIAGRPLCESYGSVYVVQNPPSPPLSMQEMDDVYALPYTRKAHPSYEAAGGIPALKEVQFSLVSSRGCFGGCHFCALTFHQGRILQARTHESIMEEAIRMTKDPDFKGYIHDVGGPTANFRHPSCQKQLTRGVCKNRQCLFPSPCPNLRVDHTDYTALLRKLRALPGVKKVFVRSGVRFDYVMADPDPSFLEELVRYHISGQLKVAPEHISDPVLRCLGKPEHRVYEAFVKQYKTANARWGMDQYLVPYFMSSHPGCTLKDAVKLAEYLRDIGHQPEQVQDFYPTPSTISTCMYYTGIHPLTGEKVYVPKDPHEKAMQRALMQYRSRANYDLVEEALLRAHREDLIGYSTHCLIRPKHKKQQEMERANAGRERRGTDQKPGQKMAKKKTIRHVHKKKQDRI